MHDVGETWPRFCRLWPQQSRKGQQQYYLPPGIRNWDLEAPQPAAPRNAVPSSFPATVPGFPDVAGAGWMPGRRVLVLVVMSMALAAIIRPLNQLGPLQWQKEVNGCRHGLSACSSCLSSSFARRAFLVHSHTAPISVTRHRTFLCFIASWCHA